MTICLTKINVNENKQDYNNKYLFYKITEYQFKNLSIKLLKKRTIVLLIPKTYKQTQ